MDRGGPDLLTGTLVAVRRDYIVVRSDDGIEYHVPLHHPKSIAIIADEPGHSEGADDAPATFSEFLAGLQGRRIQLYRHGPERAVGEVIDCGDDYVALKTDSGEVLYYAVFHIRSVCLDPPETGQESDPSDPPPPETSEGSDLPRHPTAPPKPEHPLPRSGLVAPTFTGPRAGSPRLA